MSQSPQASTDQGPSVTLPVLGIVLSVLCFPVGLVLAIVSMVKYSSAVGTSAKTLSVVALVVSLAMVGLQGVGCLAAIAIPNFVKYQCKSKQSEAKANLRALGVAEHGYAADNGGFSADLHALGFEAHGVHVRYDYVVDRADKEHFHAVATAKPGAAGELNGDSWEIDESGLPRNTVDGCR